MQTIKLSLCVEDMDLYPRNQVDSTHVGYIFEAMKSGADMPPIIVESKGFRIIDGFHRWRAMCKMHGPDAEAEVIVKTYKNKSDMFLDAVKYNASHGRNLSENERTRCLIKAEEFKISTLKIAGIMNITMAKVGKMKDTKIAMLKMNDHEEKVALKRPVVHFAGQTITADQERVNRSLGGDTQLRLASQLCDIIEFDLVDSKNQALMSKLGHLHDMLDDLLE